MISHDLKSWIRSGNWSSITACLNDNSPENYDATAWLARGLLLTYGPETGRNPERALASLETACQLEPDNSHILCTLSELQLQAGQKAKALLSARQAWQADSSSTIAAIALGRATFACGNQKAAYRSYLDAARLLPSGPSPVRQQVETMLLRLQPCWFEPVQGQRIRLVRTSVQHHDFILSCRQNSEFQHLYNIFQPTDAETVKSDIEFAQRHPMDSKRIDWVIEHNDKPIGLAALGELDLANSRAEYLLGFPAPVLSAISAEAIIMVLGFGFVTLNLNTIYGHIYQHNPVSQRNALHIGFSNKNVLNLSAPHPLSGEPVSVYYNEYHREEFLTNRTVSRLSSRLLGQPITAQLSVQIPDTTAEDLKHRSFTWSQ